MQTVRMSHPRLGGRTIEVPASAARIWARSGWEMAEEPRTTKARRTVRQSDDKQREG